MTALSRLRIGVLGSANIARMFCTSVAPSSAVVVSAVASRDKEKAVAFARDLRIPRAFGSYEELLADADIDAIYVPLPNSMHAEWAIRAAEAGKHVLCEKPIAVSAAEAKSMFEAARRNKVVLREGYPYMAQPQTAILRGWLVEGAIGRLRLIRSSFGGYFDNPANIRLNPTLGGGALFDAGSYAVSLVRLVVDERPTRVHAAAEYGATGVDLTTVATLAFQSGLLAQVSCSFATGYHRHALIAGDNGAIETNYLNHPPMSGPAVLQIKRGRVNTAAFEPAPVPDGNGFLLQADSFARLVREGEAHWTGASPQESIDIMLTLDAIRKSASTGRWEEVAA
ncbi:MAG: Gfo/Idh/MocA family protein [Hyphomicrobiaceae bacterium]